MKIQVNRKHIEDTMKILGSIAGRRWPELFSAIQFEAAAGKISACAFDGQIYCSADIDAVVSGEGVAMLKADALVGLVAVAPADELRLSFDKGSTLLQSGRSKYRIQTLMQHDISAPTVHQWEWVTLPAAMLRDAVTFCMGHCGVKDVRHYLNAVSVQIRDRQLRVYGSDGHRMARWVGDVDVDNLISGLIPQFALQRFLSCLPGVGNVEFSLSGMHVGLRDNGLFLDCKQVDGRPPDFERAFPPAESSVSGTINVQSLLGALRRSSVVIRGSVRDAMVFRFGPDPLLKYENGEASADEPFEAECHGSAEIGLSAPYMIQALDAFGDMESVKYAIHDACIRLDAPGRSIVVMQVRF